jgi:hypothetical protein
MKSINKVSTREETYTTVKVTYLKYLDVLGLPLAALFFAIDMHYVIIKYT